MSLLDPFWIVLVLFAIAVVVAGVFAYKLYRQGVPKDQLAKQVGLKGADILDAVQERMVAAMAEYAAKHPAKLEDAYFDASNFQQALGRLPVSFTQAVSLKPANGEAKIERDGTMPPIQYAVQPNGNVQKVIP